MTRPQESDDNRLNGIAYKTRKLPNGGKQLVFILDGKESRGAVSVARAMALRLGYEKITETGEVSYRHKWNRGG